MKIITGKGTLYLATLLVGGSPVDLSARSRDVRFERLSVEHGLSQSTVRVIYQDRAGFMWFATECDTGTIRPILRA